MTNLRAFLTKKRFIDITKQIRGKILLECTFVSCYLFSKRFLFGSIYLPQKKNAEIDRCVSVLRKISKMDFDYVYIGGDFNAWHSAWGAPAGLSGNQVSRGNKLFKGMDKLDFSPTRMPCPTRLSNAYNDTFVDFFICSDISRVDHVEVGRKISDHCFCTCALSFCTTILGARRVIDFYRTYRNPLSMKALSDYFEAVDFVDLFTDVHIEDLPKLLNEVILDGWYQYGVSKVINKKSPLVCSCG